MLEIEFIDTGNVAKAEETLATMIGEACKKHHADEVDIIYAREMPATRTSSIRAIVAFYSKEPEAIQGSWIPGSIPYTKGTPDD